MTEDNEFAGDDERSLTEDEKRQQLEREQLLRSYQKIFSTREGKFVLWDLLSRCHILHSTFRAENTKIQDFLEGERSIGLYVLAQMEVADIEGLKELKNE